MRGEFLRTITEDGIELQGLLCMPASHPSDKGFLHIHGLSGNFYENRFIDLVADEVAGRDYWFLTINTRGHDYLSDLLKRERSGWSCIPGGGMHESFELCLSDIQAWIDVLANQGCKEIVIEGHSLGASKAIYYVTETKNPRVIGLVLASLPDIKGVGKKYLGKKYTALLEMAKKQIASGKGSNLMPAEAMPGYLISSYAFLDLYGENSLAAVFPLENGTGFGRLADINIPVLAFYGTADEAVIGETKEALQVIRRQCISSPRVDIATIEGASHNYIGYEEQVANLVGRWLP